MRLSLAKARVNIKSLAAESIIIRKEMKRLSLTDSNELYNHKVNVLKPEARLANLAVGFLKGRKRSEIEKTKKPLDFKRLYDKLRKFDWGISKEKLEEWLKT